MNKFKEMMKKHREAPVWATGLFATFMIFMMGAFWDQAVNGESGPWGIPYFLACGLAIGYFNRSSLYYRGRRDAYADMVKSLESTGRSMDEVLAAAKQFSDAMDAEFEQLTSKEKSD